MTGIRRLQPKTRNTNSTEFILILCPHMKIKDYNTTTEGAAGPRVGGQGERWWWCHGNKTSFDVMVAVVVEVCALEGGFFLLFITSFSSFFYSLHTHTHTAPSADIKSCTGQEQASHKDSLICNHRQRQVNMTENSLSVFQIPDPVHPIWTIVKLVLKFRYASAVA